ncbi:hypothetical protein AC249_AIPGENE24099 [Exaiptasia diaphana]|nr:hypothetical protein AC249_AIPGENE24099 [Exaiptasia diaphana]
MDNVRYEFKLRIGSGARERCAKLFFSSLEVKTLDFPSLMEKVLERLPSLRGKEISMKYLDDRKDWIDLGTEDLDCFIDMIETARDSTRENLKVIQMKASVLSLTPQDGAKASESKKRARVSPSPSPSPSPGLKPGISHNVPKKTKCLSVVKSLQFEDRADTAGKTYVSPTDRFFEKLSKEKQEVDKDAALKQRELSELQKSSMPLDNATNRSNRSNKPPLCSNCHLAGHNKAICSFPPCTSATFCKEIKRHPDEDKYLKNIEEEKEQFEMGVQLSLNSMAASTTETEQESPGDGGDADYRLSLLFTAAQLMSD